MSDWKKLLFCHSYKLSEWVSLQTLETSKWEPFSWFEKGGAHLSRALIKFFKREEGFSFESEVRLGRSTLSDNYGKYKYCVKEWV